MQCDLCEGRHVKEIWQRYTEVNWYTLMYILICAEAEKQAQVAKIVWEQKIMEKESEKRIAEIEGRK